MVASIHCDDETLDRLLQAEIYDEHDPALEHIESCESCQQRLEDKSQSEVTWDEVREMLDVPCSETGTSTSGSQLADVQYNSSRVLEILESSDREDSLGKFGRYEITDVLGQGGMGIVMRGYDSALNRYCAVKVLAPELATSAAARKRFSREAKSAAAVVHQHVVPIQTVNEHDGLPFLVMPVIDGESLEQRVKSKGPLSIVETIRIAAQIAEGLAAAHAQGLIHRDIKPANILLESGVERVQITDFGLARAVDDASMTRSGVIAGTPQYMSPEQAHGDTLDARSDQFSLGSVIYFMLTGRSPFRAETTMGVLNRIGNDAPRSLQSINSGIPAWLDRLVMKLLSKSALDRFESAEQIASLFDRWLAHLQQPSTIAPPEPLISASASSRWLPPVNRWIIGAAAAAFSLIAGVIIVLETDRGTITIESDSKVLIRIRQGGEVVKTLTVEAGKSSTRIRSGKYTVEIDGPSDGYELRGNEVVVKRGDVKLIQVSERVSAVEPPANQSATSESLKENLVAETPKTQMEYGAAVCVLFQPFDSETATMIDRTTLLNVVTAADDVTALTVSDSQIYEWKRRGTPEQQSSEIRSTIIGSGAMDAAFDQKLLDPALQAGLNQLKSEQKNRKQLILVTDGSPVLADDSILQRYQTAGISISVIHVDNDVNLSISNLLRMASTTGGDYFRVDPALVSRISFLGDQIIHGQITQDQRTYLGLEKPEMTRGSQVTVHLSSDGHFRITSRNPHTSPPTKPERDFSTLASGIGRTAPTLRSLHVIAEQGTSRATVALAMNQLRTLPQRSEAIFGLKFGAEKSTFSHPLDVVSMNRLDRTSAIRCLVQPRIYGGGSQGQISMISRWVLGRVGNSEVLTCAENQLTSWRRSSTFGNDISVASISMKSEVLKTDISTEIFDVGFAVALEQLCNCASDRKQLIVVAMGSCVLEDRLLLAKYKANGIRISVVHVDTNGGQSTRELLSIAIETGGQYFRVDPSSQALAYLVKQIATGDEIVTDFANAKGHLGWPLLHKSGDGLARCRVFSGGRVEIGVLNTQHDFHTSYAGEDGLVLHLQQLSPKFHSLEVVLSPYASVEDAMPAMNAIQRSRQRVSSVVMVRKAMRKPAVRLRKEQWNQPLLDRSKSIQPRDTLAIRISNVLPQRSSFGVLPELPVHTYPSGVTATGYPFVVTANGTLRVPLIAPVPVAGKTVREAEAMILEIYVKNEILKADATVIVARADSWPKISVYDPIGQPVLISPPVWAEPESKIAASDTVSVYLPGILSADFNVNQPVVKLESGQLVMGYPHTVKKDGTISLPQIGPFKVEGLTVREAEEGIRQLVLQKKLLVAGRATPILTLIKGPEVLAKLKSLLRNEREVEIKRKHPRGQR